MASSSLILRYLLIFTLLCGMSSCKLNSKNENLQFVKITKNFKFYNDGSIKGLKDTVMGVYSKPYILYQIPVYYILEKPDGAIEEIAQFNHFLFREHAKQGYYFEKESPENILKVSVDSMLLLYAPISLGTPVNNPDLEEISSIDKDGEIEKVYIPKKKYNETVFDTLIYSFNKKWNNIIFSLSPVTDSAAGMKLNRIKYIFNSKYSEKEKHIIPSRINIINLEVESSQMIRGINDSIKKWRKNIDEVFPYDKFQV